MGVRGIRGAALAFGLAAACLPGAALAHADRVVTPGEAVRLWRLDPFLSITLLLTAWLYWRGASRLNRVARRGGRAPLYPLGRQLWFWCGWLVLFIALDSPLDLATGTVFSAHMIQHMLLIAVAPPLLLAGRPIPACANGLPRSVRTRLAPVLTPVSPVLRFGASALVAWLLATATLWVWHEPTLYQAAVRHEWAHLLEHVTFIISALLFWWAIVPAHTAGTSLSPGMAILSLFGMGMQGGALGALLTFSGGLWYPIYAGRSDLWHLTALSDQRLAGLIMWIPAGSVYVMAAILVLGRWLRDDDVVPVVPRQRSMEAGTGG